MRGSSLFVGILSLWWVFGCSGAGKPPPQPAPVASEPAPVAPEPAQAAPEPASEAPVPPAAGEWIDEAVALALEWEVQPGTSPEEDPERPGQLRTFFEAHPEYSDSEKLYQLQDPACAFGIEGAHERLGAKKEPLVVEVSSDDWRVMVAVAGGFCTSDDWAWFTNEVQETVKQKKITYEYATADNDVLVIRRAGKELLRRPLDGQGYVMLAAGKEPGETGHDMVPGVLAAASDYFGVALSE